jgi:hypothetical protein
MLKTIRDEFYSFYKASICALYANNDIFKSAFHLVIQKVESSESYSIKEQAQRWQVELKSLFFDFHSRR